MIELGALTLGRRKAFFRAVGSLTTGLKQVVASPSLKRQSSIIDPVDASSKRSKSKQPLIVQHFSTTLPKRAPTTSPDLHLVPHCNVCNKVFSTPQGLSGHLPYCPGELRVVEVVEGKKGRRGSSNRQSYTLAEKFQYVLTIEKIIQSRVHLQEDLKARRRAAIQEYLQINPGGPSKSNLNRWLDDKQILLNYMKNPKTGESYALNTIRSFTSRRLVSSGHGRYPELESKLMDKFRLRRNDGLVITGLWLRLSMRELISDHMNLPPEEIDVGRGWLSGFLSRHDIVLRRKTNEKSFTMEECLPKLKSFHAGLVRRSQQGKLDDDSGRWRLVNRFNVDQVPFNMTGGTDTTYEQRGSTWVFIKGRSGQHKSSRDATLQITINLSGKSRLQPKPIIMFRGLGRRLTEAERAAWDPRVVVKFSPKAYYNDDECLLWALNDFGPYLKMHNETTNRRQGKIVLFADNLSGQTRDEFKQALAQHNCEVHYYPPGMTDKLQVIDRHIGAHIKLLMRKQRDAWLLVQENADRWFGTKNTPTLQSWELRVLMTRWLGAAWTQFLAELDEQEPMNLIQRSTAATGCNLGPEGFDPMNQKAISIPGLDGYEFSEGDAPPMEELAEDHLEDPILPLEEGPQPVPSPADMVDVDAPFDEEIDETPSLKDDDVVVTSSFLPAGLREVNHSNEFFLEPDNLINQLVYFQTSSRRCRDWFLALVRDIAPKSDQFLEIDLTHLVSYQGLHPPSAKPNATGTDWTELVDLRRRWHRKTFFFVEKIH